ncbi:hypothetical protein ES707_14726 [subsurface metagenome]
MKKGKRQKAEGIRVGVNPRVCTEKMSEPLIAMITLINYDSNVQFFNHGHHYITGISGSDNKGLMNQTPTIVLLNFKF